MPKKKASRRKAPPSSMVSSIESGIKKMQHEAEGLLKRARAEAVRLSHEQRRVLDHAVAEVKQFRTDFERMARRTSKDLEARSKHVLATLENQVEKRLEPVVNRLIGQSRQDAQKLSARVRRLEQLMKQHSHEQPVAPVQSSVAVGGESEASEI